MHKQGRQQIKREQGRRVGGSTAVLPPRTAPETPPDTARRQRAIVWTAASALLCVGAVFAASPGVDPLPLDEPGTAQEPLAAAPATTTPRSPRQSPTRSRPSLPRRTSAAERFANHQARRASAQRIEPARKVSPPAPPVAIHLFGERADDKLDALGWTFDGPWTGFYGEDPTEVKRTKTLLTLGFGNSESSVRLPLARSVDPTQHASGWRFEVGFEFPDEAALHLEIQEDGELPALTVRLVKSQVEVMFRQPGSEVSVAYTVPLVGPPSEIALEWRGQDLTLDVKRADGAWASRSLKLEAPTSSPDPRRTSLELGFSELPNVPSAVARLHDPTLFVLEEPSDSWTR